ncbi:hypothetical protein COU57_03645 [Candidatus Pacearchaeota archaeon CG10_big_fil_rev_8_21_14_0_10_32_14]|nr:MAG: hypothetical protein COU57_03645 [Candidatus Pacearchaeota archaeon CG10_big_fil_rev_8_21_14_0_10_32_14]
MAAKEILKFCIEKGFLLDKEVLDLLNESNGIDTETGKLIIEKIGAFAQKRVITRSVFDQNKEKLNQILFNLPGENKTQVEKLKIKLGINIEISREINEEEVRNIVKGRVREIKPPLNVRDVGELNLSGVKILSMDPTSSKKIEVADFVKHYRNRYSEMSNLFKERGELENLSSINKISGNNKNISIVGLVNGKKITKNKNLLIELEDLTGKITVIVNANKPDLFKKAEDIALDSVIAVKGTGSKEILFVNEIYFPDSNLAERKKSPVEEYALFTGDIHVGIDKFLENNFMKFIHYLNGRLPGAKSEEVDKIKYLFLVGDIVAGVGIYPGQEHELLIADVEEQYVKAAELLKKIREDITIIVSPGNHDALRIMEPQPLLDEKFAWPLYELKNVVLTGNPALVNIGEKRSKELAFSGFDVLTYHGYSYHHYANTIPRLMQEKAVHTPEKIMSYLLKNRHLAPTHSSTLYFPSVEDSLFIRKVPDIFLSGHTHKSGVTYYNNVLVISSSCWESLTAFQEKTGNKPDFCKVPMFNMKTREVKILDFE